MFVWQQVSAMKWMSFVIGCLAASQLYAAEVKLPDPLVSNHGFPISTPHAWKQLRRPELLELFRQNVYGRAPMQRPQQMDFTVRADEGFMDGSATRKQVKISFAGPGGTSTFNVVLFIPVKAPRPLPCFLFICNRGVENIDPTRSRRSPFWPAEAMVKRGYATAAFHVAEIDPDVNDGFTNGVHGIFDSPGARKADAWGTIAAWAWGASRVMDYLDYDPDIDSRRVAVVGHSRGGKTSLWAAAEDERFAMAVSNDSGSTGAALSRTKQGERIRNINQTFPHWFCENYKRFNDRENDLPVDQHELLALIAPRLLYVASASQDSWSDPKAEFQAAVEATPVYRLYGLSGLGTDKMPGPEQPLALGRIGYHLRTGKHDLTEYDWACFMDFADQFMR
jgi:pimeloyl-ACP methyl ester carboxylesterase